MPRNILQKIIDRNQKQIAIVKADPKIIENPRTLKITNSFKGSRSGSTKSYQLFEAVSGNAQIKNNKPRDYS